ncbi:hypothetical protein ACIRBY_21215 [Streptomyces sp. NPDC096136]|uniref:hypothetical protein n=1 Tax=Streptomyces sp. NPDC096136 TaxID=3366076 RepID=UPI0038046803
MNEELRRFASVYLDREVVYDDMRATREALKHFKPEWTEGVRLGLLAVLDEKPLTADEWESVTSIEFETDDALHVYLRDLYDFLFGGSEKQPALPED